MFILFCLCWRPAILKRQVVALDRVISGEAYHTNGYAEVEHHGIVVVVTINLMTQCVCVLYRAIRLVKHNIHEIFNFMFKCMMMLS